MLPIGHDTAVLVVSEQLHGPGKQGRVCPSCGAHWTVQFDRSQKPTVPAVYRNSVACPDALLDMCGNNVAVGCDHATD